MSNLRITEYDPCMSNPNPPAAAPPWIRWLGLVGLFGFGVFLSVYFHPVASAADASGYLNSAKLLAHGRLTTTSRVVPELKLSSTFQLVPLGFTCEPLDGSIRLSPTYPVGVPLQLAAAGLIAGWNLGPYLVCVGGSLAAVWLCYLTARELGLSPLSALAGAAALGLSPVFVFIAVQPLSDVQATTWCLAAAYCALRAHRAPGRGWALACGGAAAMAVLVRPSDVLLFPTVVLLIGRPRQLLAVALGGLPAAIALLAYQHHLYGDAFRSGYGSIFEWFHAGLFGPTLAFYATWLPAVLCPALLILAVAALGRWRERPRVISALMLWAATFGLFYAFYEATSADWWCLRFLLPALPAVILLGLLGAEHLFQRSPRRLRFCAATIIVWSTAASWYWGSRLHVLGQSRIDPTYVSITDWMRTQLPPNAVAMSMVASGAIFYYTDFPLLRWDCMPADEFKRHALTLQRAGRPVYAVLFEIERERAFAERLPGRWEKAQDFKAAAVWKWIGPP
jgi:hypothetical protein